MLSGSLEQLRPEHIFLALLSVDPSLVFRKLRNTGIDIKEFFAQVRENRENEMGNPYGVFKVMCFASKFAAADGLISTQHLVAAILLDDSNAVARHLKDRGINIRDLVSNKFTYIPNAAKVCQALVQEPLTSQGERRSDPELADALSQTLTEIMEQRWKINETGHKPVAQTPPATSLASDKQNPEERAREWLRQLIPDQADKYIEEGCVEVGSSLFPQRIYRVHYENVGTEVYQKGKKVALCCMHLVDPSLPPTDRVIGEYFYIRGDERNYLHTANITRL